MNKRKLIITHIDLDMVGTVVLLHYFNILNDNDDIICVNYHDYENGEFDYEQLENYDKVIYTDMCPDSQSLDILKKNNIPVEIYDHHVSAKETIDDYDTSGMDFKYVFDNDRSGTEIVYDEFKTKKRLPKSVKEFKTLVGVYDLWKEESPLFERGQDLNRLLWKSLNYAEDGYYKYFNFIQKMYRRLITYTDEFKFTGGEERLLKEERKKELELAQKAMDKMLIRTDEKGKKFGLIKVRKKISIIAHKILLAKKGKIDYIIIINEYKKNEPKISLRSKGFNLLELNYCKGHENACGTNDFPKEKVEKLWKGEIFELGYK